MRLSGGRSVPRAEDIKLDVPELERLLSQSCSCEEPRAIVRADMVPPSVDNGQPVYVPHGTVTTICANCIALRLALRKILFTADEATHVFWNPDGVKCCSDARCRNGEGPCQAIQRKLWTLMGNGPENFRARSRGY